LQWWKVAEPTAPTPSREQIYKVFFFVQTPLTDDQKQLRLTSWTYPSAIDAMRKSFISLSEKIEKYDRPPRGAIAPEDVRRYFSLPESYRQFLNDNDESHPYFKASEDMMVNLSKAMDDQDLFRRILLGHHGDEEEEEEEDALPAHDERVEIAQALGVNVADLVFEPFAEPAAE
jgi:hypothetical protein